MEAWQLWLLMAGESAEAARLAETSGCIRSAASRYYYAAYQIVTALLLYRGLTPPTGREAWSHVDTPQLLQDQMQTVIRSRSKRSDLAQRLVKLYALRLNADYEGMPPKVAQVRQAGRDARYLLTVANGILPEGATE